MADVTKNDLDNDYLYQIDENNIIPSRSDINVSDAQKRFRSRGLNPNHPKPKTLFYVIFETESSVISSELSEELSKFVKSVTKPNITMGSKSFNQYNKQKYVYTDIKYSDLKLTFYDVKDNPVQQSFFNYLKSLAYDFEKHSNDFENSNFSPREYNNGNDWGLKLIKDNKKIKSITIAEPIYNKLMVYTIPNPVFDNIQFNDNTLGDYSVNEITVNFKVEGMTNDICLDGKWVENVIGKSFSEIGGADMAHFLQKRWGIKSTTKEVKKDAYKDSIMYDEYKQRLTAKANINNQLLTTQEKLELASNEYNLKQIVGDITDPMKSIGQYVEESIAKNINADTVETATNLTSALENAFSVASIAINPSLAIGLKIAFSKSQSEKNAIEQPSVIYDF